MLSLDPYKFILEAGDHNKVPSTNGPINVHSSYNPIQDNKGSSSQNNFGGYGDTYKPEMQFEMSDKVEGLIKSTLSKYSNITIQTLKELSGQSL